MKGIILASGKGTRLAPFTNVLNKQLAPVYTHEHGAVPMLDYPLNTLKNSGCTEILVITSNKCSGDIIDHYKDGYDMGLDITYKIQPVDIPDRPLGIAAALKLAKNFVKPSDDSVVEPFAVILGDNYFEESFQEEFKNFEQKAKEQSDIAQVFLKEVSHPERFGVAELNGDKVVSIEEKPETPITNLAVVGLYLYTTEVFNILPKLTVSNRGELEITDVNNWYVNNDTLISSIIPFFWHDMGTVESMIKTIEFINRGK